MSRACAGVSTFETLSTSSTALNTHLTKHNTRLSFYWIFIYSLCKLNRLVRPASNPSHDLILRQCADPDRKSTSFQLLSGINTMVAFVTGLDRRKASWTSIWTWLITLLTLSLARAASEKTQADYFVHSLPGQPEGPLLKMHAG